MVRLILLLLVPIYLLLSSLMMPVMAQNLPRESEPFPTVLRFEGLLPGLRAAPASPGALVPHSNPYSSAPVVNFESTDGAWTVTRTIKLSTNSNNGLWGNLASSISISSDDPPTAPNRDKVPVAPNQNKFAFATPQSRFSQVPSGVKIGYGLSYYLPVSQSFSAFAQLKPPSIKSIFSFKNVFMAPQTMLTAGFQMPLISAASPQGHNVSLNFSGAVDQQFRPILSITINLTPFRK